MIATNAVMPDLMNRRVKMHFATALNILRGIGVDPSQITLKAVGTYRNYAGEVQYQHPEAGESVSARTHIELHVGMSSAVDFMPYQFFYGLGGNRVGGSAWEDEARALLSPFDAEVIRHDAGIQYQRLRYSFGVFDREFILRYLKLFGFDLPEEYQTPEDLLVWAGLLPSFNHWAGNAEQVAIVIRRFFRVNVRIEENVAGRYTIPRELRVNLGTTSSVLGRGWTLGKTFSECDSSFEVHIEDLDPEQVSDFLPEQPLRRKLEWMIGLCMPGNLEFTIRVHTTRRPLALGRADGLGHLGYASYV